MSSTSETGHGKNVAIFNSLISKVTSMGSTYNPSNPILTIDVISAQYRQAKADLRSVFNMSEDYNRVTNDRQAIYKETLTLVTRVLYSLLGAQVSPETIADARRIQRKINGQRAKAIAEAAPLEPGQPAPDEKNISASQRSYDNQANNFSTLLKLITKEPKYNPNEEDLTVEAVTLRLTALDDANDKVVAVTTNLGNARAARNTSLYMDETGLTDTSLAIKYYIKSIKLMDKELRKVISGLQLKKVVKKGK
jgi:hypothetical protein